MIYIIQRLKEQFMGGNGNLESNIVVHEADYSRQAKLAVLN